MNLHLSRQEAFQIAVGLLIAAAVLAAFAIDGELLRGSISAVILLGFVLAVFVGRRRSDTLDVMSGIGDERSRTLYTRAVAVAGTVMAFVLPGWWLLSVARGEEDPTLSVLSAVFGVTFIVSVIVLARRS